MKALSNLSGKRSTGSGHTTIYGSTWPSVVFHLLHNSTPNSSKNGGITGGGASTAVFQSVCDNFTGDTRKRYAQWGAKIPIVDEQLDLSGFDLNELIQECQQSANVDHAIILELLPKEVEAQEISESSQ